MEEGRADYASEVDRLILGELEGNRRFIVGLQTELSEEKRTNAMLAGHVCELAHELNRNVAQHGGDEQTRRVLERFMPTRRQAGVL